jgi:two-component system sensor histidine kinase RegB
MTSYQSIDQAANRKNLAVLINLRGLAFCGQILAIFVTSYGLNIVLPVVNMVVTASALALLNLYSLLRLRQNTPIRNGDLFAGLVIDVIVLGLQLYFSGGTSNPFVSFFMLPVIIGAVMLETAYAWAVYGLTLLAYLALAITGPWHTMPKMMDMPGMDMSGHAVTGLVDRSSLHMNGMMLGYGICAGVLVFMISRIRANLHERDAEVDKMKTAAAEEAHIVRMGLLSAGAAHELGTPLTTLSVILQDWYDLPLLRKKSDLTADIQTMQTQVRRCKAIVSDILTLSGDARGEGASVQTLEGFLHEAVATWRLSHPQADLSASIEVGTISVVADRVLQQALINLLDNAQEAVETADARGVALIATIAGENLIVTITDNGPGFDDDIIKHLGQPYISTKGKSKTGHGRGLGLFLVTNILRKLGGAFTAANSTTSGGGNVRVTLPLAAIRVVENAR